MKLLMRAVLLGMSGSDALGQDAEANPPRRERRQATEPGPPERRPIVTANAVGHAVLGKRALEPRPRHREGVRRQRIAPQHIPTEAIAQREGIAVASIPGEKLAFVIDRPHLIGPRDDAPRSPRSIVRSWSKVL